MTRILCKYQDGDKSKKFVVKAGFMEGKVMDAAETILIDFSRIPYSAFRFLAYHNKNSFPLSWIQKFY